MNNCKIIKDILFEFLENSRNLFLNWNFCWKSYVKSGKWENAVKLWRKKKAEKWGKFVVIWKRFKNCTNNHKRRIRRKGRWSEREENDDDNDEQWRIRTFSWPRITNDVVNVASFWPQRKIYHRNRDANRRERHWNKFMCISVFDYYLNLLWLCFSFARFPSFSLLAVVFFHLIGKIEENSSLFLKLISPN